MTTLYESFVQRHRPALLLVMREPVVKTTPGLAPDDREAYTGRVVDNLIAHCLARTGPEIGVIQAEGRRLGVRPDGARQRAAFFIETLDAFCRVDETLADTQRTHILRMLASSHRYMQTIAVTFRDEGSRAEGQTE